MKTAQQVKEDALRNSKYQVMIDPGVRGAIVGYLNEALGGDEYRRIVLGWLFDFPEPLSSKALLDGQWFALHSWIVPRRDESTGHWVPGENFAVEARLVLTSALVWNEAVKPKPPEDLLSIFDEPVIASEELPEFEINKPIKEVKKEMQNNQPTDSVPAFPAWSKPPTKKSALRPIRF